MSTNQKLFGLGIIVAIGTLPTALNAAPEVKVYGKANASIANTSVSEADVSETYISSGGSRMGVKATEKVAKGHEAFAVFEFGIDLRKKNNVITKRNQHVGLKTDFGSIMMGYNDTPYKKAKAEPFADTFADQNAILSKGIELRAEDAVYFKSKEIAGVTLFAAFSDSPQDSIDGSKNISSVSLTYKMKPVKVMVAHQILGRQDYVDDEGTAMKSDDIISSKVVVSGKAGPVKFGVAYETVSDETGDTSIDRTNMGVNAAYRTGEWEGVVEHVSASESEATAGKDGASMSTLAVKRHLSDNFHYYLMFSTLANDENGTYKPKNVAEVPTGTAKETYNTGGLGMVFKF